MRKPKRLLSRIENEVIEAKTMLKSKRAELARSRNKLKRDNAQRAIRTIEQSLDNIRDHRHLLEEEAAGQKSVVAKNKRQAHRDRVSSATKSRSRARPSIRHAKKRRR